MEPENTKKLNDLLTQLYEENTTLAIKIESTWGTEFCSKLLQTYVSERHNKLSSTTYQEYHSLLNLAMLHSQEFSFSNCDIENLFAGK